MTSFLSPSMAVCGLLDQQVITPPTPGITLEFGVNLFRGPIRAVTTSPSGSASVPHTAVFALTMGGKRPTPYHGEGKDRLYADVTVVVRMQPNRFEDGEDFARAVWRQLQRNVPENTTYLECFANTSEPAFMGLDDTEHPMWSLNFQLIRVE